MKNLLIIAIASISILIAACNGSGTNTGTTSDTTSVKTAGITYTCPMHPEVINDKPDQCPKCEMTLVKKENGKKHSSGKKM